MKLIKRSQQERYQCNMCDADHETMESLLLHKESHASLKVESDDRKKGRKRRRQLECDQCDVKVTSQYHLDIHKSKHERNPAHKYVCEVCNRTFVAAQFLRTHMQTHSATSPIKCLLCNKCFTGQVYLKLHMQLHEDTDNKEHKCEKCLLTVATKGLLKLHMKTYHTRAKNFKCDYCDKHFITRILMEKHRIMHEYDNVEGQVRCTQCDRTIQAGLLRTHMQRVHVANTDDGDIKRPHKCFICGKCFIVKLNLNLHLRVCHSINEADDSGDEDYKE